MEDAFGENLLTVNQRDFAFTDVKAHDTPKHTVGVNTSTVLATDTVI